MQREQIWRSEKLHPCSCIMRSLAQPVAEQYRRRAGGGVCSARGQRDRVCIEKRRSC
jgi:hypothetical protein